MGNKAAVEIRLLGSFGLLVDGQIVPTGSWRLRKAKDVVKILALARGHRRHRDEVIEALWPERDSGSGLNNLHQALHIARRGLASADGSGRGRLRVREEWVELCPDGDLRVDVEEFEVAAAAADGSGDARLLDSALLLYRGDLLPEDRYEDWVVGRRDELRALRRRLATALAGIREAAGDPQAAVDLLGTLVADDPADEVAQRALMRGYALSGDRGAALRQYRTLVAELRDSLEVPPDAQTEQVYRDVLAGRLSGGAPAVAAVTVNGAAGQKDPPPPERGRLALRHPRPDRPRPRAGHNLPVRLSTFIGRDSALEDIGALLGERRLITLTGPGGCGKSRLAVEVAQQALPRFSDGVWLAELAAASGAGDDAVGRVLAQDLAVGERSGQSPLDAVAADLAGKQSLLVIDNCEHRVDSAARAVAGLLKASPELVVLATSREPLRVPGEVLWRVPSLEMPDPHHLPSLVELDCCESVRLFVDRAMAADPGFFLDEDNAAAVAEICFRLDGLPLAIELAAARVPALGARGIADRLDDRFRLLTEGSRTALSRQRTLAATFDWSYELLSGPEQAAFRRLSVFTETFSLSAARAVATGDEVDSDDMAAVLPDLVARSMISIAQQPAAFRYRLIETLREYGRARLAEAGETEAVQQRHAAWYLRLAIEAAGHFADPGRRRWFERVDADQPDFQAALATLLGSDPPGALRLAGALWPYWVLRGTFGEGVDRLRAALAGCPDQSAARVEALIGSFALRVRWIGPGHATTFTTEALAVARSLGDPPVIARAAFYAGVESWVRDQPVPARAAFLAAAATARNAGLVMAQASAVHALAWVAWSQSRPELARRRLREALVLARRAVASDDPGTFWQATIGSIITGWWLGAPHLTFEESIVPFQECRGLAAVAYIRASMGSLARSDGDHDVAARLFDEALALFEEAGDEAGVGLALGRLGNLTSATPQQAQAEEYLARSLSIHRELGDQRGIGVALMSLGRLAANAGHLDRASELFSEAAASFRASRDQPAMVLALTRLGELQIVRIRRGAGLAATGGGPGGAADGAADGAAGRADSAGDAVRLLESATGIQRELGHSGLLGLGLTALAEAYTTIGDQGRAADAADEAITLLALAPAELGREHALRRLSGIAVRS